jgi:streptogramin lyase
MIRVRFILVAVLVALVTGASGCSNSDSVVPAAGSLISTASSVTQRYANTISITQFDDLPGGYGADYFPAALTPGPDGALWVADDIDPDFGEPSIARMTPSGVLTKTFYYGGEYAEFADITTGPDDALWITENEQILRMTLNGKFKAFQPKNHGVTQSIAVGPDLALWFTERVAEDSAIGRITTQGKITTYEAPSGTQDITARPDGALWFTDPGESLIGRMTTRGKITEYKDGITYGSRPYSIALGPDGALWFTERKGGRSDASPPKGR